MTFLSPNWRSPTSFERVMFFTIPTRAPAELTIRKKPLVLSSKGRKGFVFNNSRGQFGFNSLWFPGNKDILRTQMTKIWKDVSHKMEGQPPQKKGHLGSTHIYIYIYTFMYMCVYIYIYPSPLDSGFHRPRQKYSKQQGAPGLAPKATKTAAAEATVNLEKNRRPAEQCSKPLLPSIILIGL